MQIHPKLRELSIDLENETVRQAVRGGTRREESTLGIWINSWPVLHCTDSRYILTTIVVRWHHGQRAAGFPSSGGAQVLTKESRVVAEENSKAAAARIAVAAPRGCGATMEGMRIVEACRAPGNKLRAQIYLGRVSKMNDESPHRNGSQNMQSTK